MPLAVRSRLAAVTLVAGSLLVPAVAAAQEDDGSTTSTTTPGPTTTLVPLVTSPAPTSAPPTTVAAPTTGRTWPVLVPQGCAAPALPDLVFLGTLEATDFRSGRFHVDQVRAGAIERFAFGEQIDVRYGIDTKYLTIGDQYLVGASLDPDTAVLSSRVAAPDPLFGGDEIIGATESDVECPVLDDPVRTLQPDGQSVESGVLAPFTDDKDGMLRSVVVPLVVAFGIVLGLVALRWLLTGLGYGLGSLFRTVREPREVRAVRRSNLRAGQPD